jgi:hypothetical protein
MKPGRVDPHAKNTKLVPTREIVEKNIAAYDLTDRVTLYTGTHPPLPEELRNTDSYFGAIFIDGDHQTQSVLNDWNELKYHASDIVIFHDLHHSTIKPAWEAIKKDPFVEEVLYEGGAGKYSRMGVVKVKSRGAPLGAPHCSFLYPVHDESEVVCPPVSPPTVPIETPASPSLCCSSEVVATASLLGRICRSE